MGLQDFFAAVEARMSTVLTGLGVPVPAFDVGLDRLLVEAAPPRIVWIPGKETHRGPHAQGGDGISNPRPLRTRHVQIQVHIWAVDPSSPPVIGGDLAAVETLLGHLVAAINDCAWGAWDVTGGDWTAGQASTTRLGMVYVLDLELQIPLTREVDPTAVVTAMPITPEVDQP